MFSTARSYCVTRSAPSDKNQLDSEGLSGFEQAHYSSSNQCLHYLEVRW